MSGSLDKTETSINVLNAFTECSDNDSSRPWPRWHHVQTQQPDKYCTTIIMKSLGSFCFFWLSVSMCREAAGNCWLLLRRPQEQTVCHSTRCRAPHPAQSGTYRLWKYICKYICDIDRKITTSHCYKVSPNDCRILPTALRCSQQGSGCSLLRPPPAIGCSAEALHWSSSLSPPPPSEESVPP